jgi:hypothetical protein
MDSRIQVSTQNLVLSQMILKELEGSFLVDLNDTIEQNGISGSHNI